jgi:protein Mpv17
MVAIDQTTLAPAMFSGFFIMNGFVNSPSIDGVKKGIEDWRNKFWETLQTNWKIWPLAIGINFWFIPAAYRVLFSNGVSFFWNIILSSIAYDKKIG